MTALHLGVEDEAVLEPFVLWKPQGHLREDEAVEGELGGRPRACVPPHAPRRAAFRAGRVLVEVRP